MKFKKNIMKTLFFVALLISIAVFAIGCNRVVKDDKGALVIESKPTAGGVLRLACVEAKALNPLLVDSKSYKDIVPFLFTGLYEIENSGKAKASLADDASVKVNGLSCSVKVKTGLKWSNGNAIKAEDVKYSFDLLKSQPTSMYFNLVKDINSCRIKNDEIIFQFRKSTPTMKESLSFPVVKKGTKNEKKTIITNGRYKVSKYVNLDRMMFSINENWNMGVRAYIPEIEVIFINDIGVFVTAFQSQEVDVVNITDYDWSKYEEIRGTVAKSYFTGEMEDLFFNQENVKLMDKRLRKAIAFGIDRQKLMEKYVIGNGLVTDSPITPGTWISDTSSVQYNLSYSDSKALQEDIKNNPLKIVTPSPTPAMTSGNSVKVKVTPTPTPKPTPSPKPGKKSKITPTPAPKVEKKKVETTIKLRLLVNSENTKRVSIANDIKVGLKAANIDVTVESVSFSEYKSRILKKDYDMYLGATTLPTIQDFSIFLDDKLPMYIRPTTKDGAYNKAKLANNAGNDADFIKAAKTFQDAFREELPFLPLYHKKGALILSGSIKGSAEVARYNVFKSEADWYFEKIEK